VVDENVQEPAGIPLPTADEMIATVQAANQRAAFAEQEKMRLEQMLATRREPPAQANDALGTFSREMFTKSDEERRVLLEQGVNQRLGNATRQIEQRMEQRLAAEREQFDSQRVIDRITNRNPDLADPSNYSRFAAMIQKATLDANAQGLRLNMDQIGERAVREYRATYNTAQRGKAPTYVEGSSAPGYGGVNPNDSTQPVQKNALEEAYGFEPGAIEAVSQEAMKKITRSYVREKNGEARKHGIGVSRIVTPVTEVS
jgi:hypothetical protein